MVLTSFKVYLEIHYFAKEFSPIIVWLIFPRTCSLAYLLLKEFNRFDFTHQILH